MENPRPEKVAVVAEVKAKFEQADTVLLTDYRGLDVPALAELRRELRAAGGEYKIYKNSLARLAAREAGLDLDALLSGPTAIAFITEKADGSPGDAAAAAKALREFSKKNDRWCSRAVCSAEASSTMRRSRRWQTCRPARCCWHDWPAASPLRSSSSPACCRPCRATLRTA